MYNKRTLAFAFINMDANPHIHSLRRNNCRSAQLSSFQLLFQENAADLHKNKRLRSFLIWDSHLYNGAWPDRSRAFRTEWAGSLVRNLAKLRGALARCLPAVLVTIATPVTTFLLRKEIRCFWYKVYIVRAAKLAINFVKIISNRFFSSEINYLLPSFACLCRI